MANKNIFDRFGDGVKKFLGANTPSQKATEPLGQLIGPVFREIPPDANGDQIINDGLRGWAYVAVSAIADEVASTDLFLFKRQGKDWKIQDEHPALALINRPNAYQTKEEFLWITTAYLLAVGEACWILNNNRNPDSMIIFNPNRVTPTFSEDHEITNYKFRKSDGQDETIPADRVIFLKLPNFKDPFRGKGVMEYITRVIDTDNFIQDYIRVFFYNSAMPHGVLQTDNEIKEEHAKRILNAWDRKHKGIKNAHRTALLDKGLKYANIDFNFQQLEMGALDMRIMNRVLATFKVPKSVLGISEDVNRANAEAASYTFARRAVMPKLKLIEAQLNQFLIPKFSEGMNLWFEFENVVVEDELTKATTRQINIASGVRTANEYRQEDGLEMLPEKNGTEEAVTGPAAQEQASLNSRITRRKYLRPVDKKLREVGDIIYEEAKKIVEKKYSKKMNTGPYPESAVNDYHAKKVENSDRIEKDFKDRLSQNQARQKKNLLSQLTGKSRKKKADLTLEFDEEQEAEILASLTQPYLERSILAQAALSAALLNIDNSLDTQDNRVRAFMKKWAGKLGKSNADTTNEAVQSILRAWGEKEDASIADLKKELGAYFEDTAKAETIARTEVSRAAGFAQETVYKDAGAIGKKWATAIDERVCPYCEEMDGKIVELNESFLDNGDTFEGSDGSELKVDYGAVKSAPLHPNCRCDLLPIFADGKAQKETESAFKRLQKDMLAAEKGKDEEKKEETEEKK